MTHKKTPTQDTGTEDQPSILKQLTGAMVGGTLALLAYYAYDYSAPVVSAWLIKPGYQATLGNNTIADSDIDSTDERRIQAQARRIAANTQHVPEYTQYTQPAQFAAASSSVPSSSMSSAENIWESSWEESQSSASSVYVPEPWQPPIVPPEPVRGAEGQPVPELPSSGFGLWALIGTAGAAVGSQYRRVRKSNQQ